MKNSRIYNDEKGDFILIDRTGYKSYITWNGKRPNWVEIQPTPEMAKEEV